MKRLATAALAVLTVLVMVFTLTACGGKAVTLTVHDKDAKTEVEANVGMTVAQVLEKAEITLGEKDETEPAKDEKIAEDTTGAVITIEVYLNYELEQLILSFGENMEVLEPKWFREKIKMRIGKGLERYGE